MTKYSTEKLEHAIAEKFKTQKAFADYSSAETGRRAR